MKLTMQMMSQILMIFHQMKMTHTTTIHLLITLIMINLLKWMLQMFH